MYRSYCLITLAALMLSACDDSGSRFSCENGKACPTGQRCESTTLLCILDDAPNITLTKPEAGALVSGSMLIVEGRVEDDAAEEITAAFSVDGQQWPAITLRAEGHFQAEVPLPTMDSEPFLISFKVTDGLGKTRIAELPLTVDNVDPRCAVANLSDTGLLLNDDGTVVVLSVTDGSPTLSDALVSVDDQPLPTDYSSKSVTATWTNPPRENGVSHTVKFRVLDAAGNLCEGSQPVILDAVGPTLSVSAPANEAILDGGWFANTPWVMGPAPEDGLNPQPTLTVDWDDGLGPKSVTVSDGGYRFTVPSAKEDYVPHHVKVTATDWAGNSTTVERTVYADTVAPKVAFVSPAPSARLKASDFANTSDVTVKFAVTDGDAQRTVSTSTDGGSFTPTQGSSVNVTTSATDNPQPYKVTVRAVDRAGNPAQAVLDFSVDRLLPRIQSTLPDNNSRNHDYQLGMKVTFTEAIAPATTVLTSTMVGNWNSQRTQWTSNPLSSDTLYALTVSAALTDDYGNPLASANTYKFTTRPFLPPQGLVAIAHTVTDFTAAVDPDGAISIFTEVDDPNLRGYVWRRLNTKSGIWESLWELPGTEIEDWQVSAWRNLQPDLTAQRVIGMASHTGAPFFLRSASSKVGEAPVEHPSADAIVPLPPMRDEVSTSSIMGHIEGTNYIRAGRAPIALSLYPDHLLYADNRFEVVNEEPPSLSVQIYKCPVGTLLNVCTLNSPTTLATDFADEFEGASTPNCSAYVYNSPTQRVSNFIYRGTCGLQNPCPQPYVEMSAIAEKTRYAPTFIGDHLLRARRNGATVQLSTRECFSDSGWADVGVPVNAPDHFQPISSGGKLGLLYINAGGKLELYWAN